MGRYSSVQAFADNNTSVSRISYEQAKGQAGGNSNAPSGSASAPNDKVVAEKVSNPYGSTAGAGSGEFHVYRHARAREAARWKELDANEKEKELEAQFQKRKAEAEMDELEKTAKRRKKRQREKEAKQRKKHLKAAGIDVDVAQPTKVAASGEGASEEFTYVPVAQQGDSEKNTTNNDKSGNDDQDKTSGGNADSTQGDDKVSAVPKIEIPNDGSFMDRMKQMLQANSSSTATTEADQPSNSVRPVESRVIDEDEGPMLPPGFSS
eukprot:Nitzschia sp. Nitz4//scaffold89_size161592//21194//21988//NITZ4_002363-RA/size161592-processed-gene-0.2-mRNA-1//1//CDS//3329559571//3371//frame0